MTLEELKAEVDELKESSAWHKMQIEIVDAQICAMQKQQPEQPKLERWKPEKNNPFWAIVSNGVSEQDTFQGGVYDQETWGYFNCFQTKEEAKQEALRTRARRKLEWLARELNSKFEGHQNSLYLIDYLNGKFYVMQLGYDWIKHGMVGLITFKCKTDAEYALSQMAAEELEALR